MGIYSYKREFLLDYANMPSSALEEAEMLEQLRVLSAGLKIKVGIVDSAAPEIDTLADYQAFVERTLAARKREGGTT